jgi:hypothetical protein
MNKYFTSSEVLLFYLTAGLQSILVFTVLARRIYKRFPIFAVVSCFWLLNNVSLYVESFWLTPVNYAYSYFAGSFVIYVLIGMIVWDEIYLNTYGPARSLPRWVPPQVLFYGCCFWLALLATGLLLPVRQTSSAISILYAVDRVAIGGLAVTLIVLIIYSLFRLHIHWRIHTLAIAIGLCFYTTMALVAAYGRYLFPAHTMSIMKQITEMAYLFSVLGWTGTLWMKDPGPNSIDPKEVKAFVKMHEATVTAADSWGINIQRQPSKKGGS